MRYREGKFKDYRKPKKEKELFRSPWIVVFEKKPGTAKQLFSRYG
jgi:hypothetical protein